MAKNIAYVPISSQNNPLIEKTNYTPTFLEWLYKNGQQITVSNNSLVNTTTTIYQVPLGYTLFITNINFSSICVRYTALGINYISPVLFISDNTGVAGTYFLNSFVEYEVGKSSNQNYSYTFPLKVYPDQKIQFYQMGASGDLYTYYGFVGFLVQNEFLK